MKKIIKQKILNEIKDLQDNTNENKKSDGRSFFLL